MPADALIYLETSDLGAAIKSVASSESFRAAAAGVPDLSALDGIPVAVAVTGFEKREQPVTDENAILTFQPHFVAVAETGAWNWQARSFAENKLGEFINEMYGGEVELEVTPKDDGRFYAWKARDGRAAFALVDGSVIYFGNDASAIDKCLAVKRGESDSIVKTGRLPKDGRPLAFGFVSTDGVAQLASLIGVSFAMKAGEESEVRSFIAGVLPVLLRNSVKDITWTAERLDDGRLSDKYSISLEPQAAKILAETMTPAGGNADGPARIFPQDVLSTTRYDLRDPQIAWRSVVLVARDRTDEVSGKLLASLSGLLFEPYAIEDAELFLSAVVGVIQTAAFDADGEAVVVAARIKDREKLKRSIAKEIDLAKPPEGVGDAEVWRSGDGEISAAFAGDLVILGDAESVAKCLAVMANGSAAALEPTTAPIATTGRQTDPAARLVTVLGDRKGPNTPLTENYFTETRFTAAGIERTTRSDLGLIGELIAQFARE